MRAWVSIISIVAVALALLAASSAGALTVTVTATPRASPTPTVDPDVCAADCDGDRRVTVAELVTAVAIALGEDARDRCPAGLCGAGRVTVACLVRGVGNAIGGCAPLTPSPTPTPVRTAPPAFDAAVSSLCRDFTSTTTRVHVGGYEFTCHHTSGYLLEASLRIFSTRAAATAQLDDLRWLGDAVEFHALDTIAWGEGRPGGTITSQSMAWTTGCWIVSTTSSSMLPAQPQPTARDMSEALYAAPGLFDACGALPVSPSTWGTELQGRDSAMRMRRGDDCRPRGSAC
jgi:hypothetical protein